MASDHLKNLRGSSRRDFIRWGTAIAAALGLERSRFLNVLGDTGGVALADTASCASTMKSVHLVAGNGGFAWFQLLWPHVDIAKQTTGNFAFHAMGKATAATTTDKPFMYAPETPWQKLGAGKQVSAFMAGANETHTNTPQTASTIGTGTGMLAAIAAIQSANPTLLPVIGINPLVFGAAPGAPAVATVANPAGLVDLFNSAASKALLLKPENAALAEAYYKAFLSLNAAAGKQTMTSPFQNGKVAMNLLGKNLASQLMPTVADQTKYGITQGTATAVADIGNALITAVKAFKLGLTSSLIIPALRDDPHGAFGAGATAPTARVAALGKILDAFMADCGAANDPACSSKSLADNVVLTVHGDTPKTPLDQAGWADNTPRNSNWLYVMGNGYLKTGWFGGVKADGTVDGFDPATGNVVAGQASTVTANAAAAAAAFAVAKGDMRRVQDFYRGTSVNGIIVPTKM